MIETACIRSIEERDILSAAECHVVLKSIWGSERTATGVRDGTRVLASQRIFGIAVTAFKEFGKVGDMLSTPAWAIGVQSGSLVSC